MSTSDPASSMSANDAAPEKYREVRYEHSRSFVPLLEQLGVSLLVSTYQAGKVVAVASVEGRLALSFHNFEQAMGMAVGPRQIAVGAKNQVWFLQSAPEIAPQLQPAGQHDACFLARSSHVTGEIHIHEMGWAGDELWVVNTLFSCLATLDAQHSFVPRWKPPFITSLAAEDRCHLNGLCLVDNRPKLVTCLSRTDTAAGWRPTKSSSGCLLDVPSGEVIAEGFAMPHSPRLHQGRVFLLDSGKGQLVVVDPASGKTETVATLPGYTRGMTLHNGIAFVGLSRIRETSTFGGVPIAENRDELKCGLAAIHLPTGNMSYLEFKTGVEEIFDVQVLPGIRNPALSGPFPTLDGTTTIRSVPAPRGS